MQSGTKTRILIVDDHFVTREGLKSLVGWQPDMEVVAEARDGAEALKVYLAVRPDVVLMDLRLPHFDGIAATAALLREDPKARILILSSYDTEDDIGRAYDAGALGYVLKEAEGEDLLRGIRAVREGKRYLPDVIAHKLAAREGDERLDARDLRLLRFIEQGLTNAEIARQLDLASGTVGNYVSALLAKLGARNRTEALSIAMAKGLLKADPPIR